MLLAFSSGLSALAADDVKRNSCQAEVFVPESLKQQRSILSPDGQFRVILGDYREEKDSEGGRLRVFQGKKELGSYDLRDLSGGMFVRWSPDSRAFFLMWSNGGMIGGYDVRIFRISSDAVREIFPLGLAEKEFKSEHKCPARGINVFAVRWLEGSDRLMIAAQVYPTSDCGEEMGFTQGFTIHLDDGAIIERQSADAIEREMRECPTLIWPTGLWDDRTLQQAKAKISTSTSEP